MTTFVLRIFQREVERQCRFALVAVEDLNAALASHDSDRIWYSVQGLLVAAGNISKLLWPPDSEHSKRGEELRASLGVSDASVLAPRTFRNHFEHFDERLEAWASSSKRHNFVDSSVITKGAISGIDPEDYLRNIDPADMALTFHGDRYLLQPIADEIGPLWQRANTEARKPATRDATAPKA